MSISPNNQSGDAYVPKNPGDRMHEEGDEVTLDVNDGVGDFEAGDWLVLGDNMNATGKVADFTDTGPAPGQMVVAKKPGTGGEECSFHFRGNIRADDSMADADRPYPVIKTWSDDSALFIVR
jgi:hypothetical protein